MADKISEEFKLAGKQVQSGRQTIVHEFVAFLKANKKWWLLPIIVLLLGFGILLMLAATGAAPFIYTLF